MITFTTTVSGNAHEQLIGLSSRIGGLEVREAVGESVQRNWQGWIRGFRGHQVGSVGFYDQCARGMTSEATADGANVDINRVGFTVRALGTAHLPGGRIFPTGGRKYLTFAASAFTYGKRARDISGLKFGFAKNPETGHFQAMLYSPHGSETVDRARNRERTGSKSKKQIPPGDIAFWLAKSAKQAGTPALIPTGDQVADWSGQGVEALLDAKGGS